MLHTQLHISEEYTKHYICYTLAYLRKIHKTLHMLHTQLHIKEEYTKHYICYTLNCTFKKNTQNTTYVTHSNCIFKKNTQNTIYVTHSIAHLQEYTKHYICYTLNCIFKKNTQNTTMLHTQLLFQEEYTKLHMLYTQLHI